MEADPLSQETIHKHWAKTKKDFAQGGEVARMMGSGNHCLTSTQSWGVKQGSSSVFSDSTKLSTALSPIQIAGLKIGQTHRNRFLLGSIADTDGFWTINSGAFLLRDLSGSAMEVAVYNSPHNNFSKAFHIGREICIAEPYLKIRADGSAGIRVEKPAEIIDYLLPQTSGDWKELGNSCIKHSPDMALTCYERALQAPNKKIMDSCGDRTKHERDDKADRADRVVHPKKNPSKKCSESKEKGKMKGGIQTVDRQDAVALKLAISKLLTNISLCEFRLGNNDSSLLYALIGFGIGIDRSKAAFRIAKALESSGLTIEARAFAAWYCCCYELGSADDQCHIFQREFNISDVDINDPSADGALWVQADTLKRLVDASSSLEQAPASLIANIKDDGAVAKDEPWLFAKQRGNDSFHKKGLSEAIEYYIAALSLCPFAELVLRDTSFIVANKGAAWLGIAADASSQEASSDKKPGNRRSILLAEGTISMFSAAMMNTYENGRAWVRASRFLQHQGRHKVSIRFLDVASSLLEKQGLTLPFFHSKEEYPSRALRFVQSELSDLRRRSKAREKVAQLSNVSTEEQLRQRTSQSPNYNAGAGCSSLKMLDKHIMEYEQGYNMFSMMGMMLEKSKHNGMRRLTGPTMDRSLEDYCAEFIRARGIPEGLDNEFARKVLYRSFVADRLHPWFRTLGWRMAWSSEKEDHADYSHLKESLTSDEDIIKRWHGTAGLSLISERPEEYAQLGAILDVRHLKPKSCSSYDDRIRSNFVNCPDRSEAFYEGTHLAIGFNDLNFLMNCKWVKSQEEEHTGNPSHFVGLEMNPFNVAKSLVIAEMLANPSIRLQNILQSWYSTVWSRHTLADFRECVKLVLEKGEKKIASHRNNEEGHDWYKIGNFSAENVSNAKVSSYLSHWLSCEPVSFKEARRLWLDNTVKQNIKLFNSISSCKRSKDRLALAHYFLTGEVFGDTNFQANSLNSVGSLPFWQCPEGSPPIEEESMFNTFVLEDLLATFSEDKRRTLVQSFEARALSKLEDIRTRVLSKKLTIELYVGIVKPLSQDDGHSLVHFIVNRIQPRTIGWSNVIDYMELRDLHDLGRAMSPDGNITHYGYSMNWCSEVFGANIFDYQMTKNYEGANVILDLALGENFSGNNELAINVLKEYGAVVGADEVFHFPDYDTPMNSTSYVAAKMTREYWVEHFFVMMAKSVGRVGDSMRSSPVFRFTPSNHGSNRMQRVTLIDPPCPLHRQSTQIYLEWTYDPELKVECTVSVALAPDSVLEAIQKKLNALLKM
ncbi:hypothetical protein ACHAXR_013582 [Thalassiosira sp. AJA248-18]